MSEVIKTILTADSSEHQAAFRKAAAGVAAYQKSQQAGFASSLEGHRRELDMLKLEAAGNVKAAAFHREYQNLRAQASALAAGENITEREAMRILQEKLLLQKKIVTAVQQEAAARGTAAARAAAIANPRATGLPGGGALAPLTPQSLQAMDRATASTRELRRQTLLAGRSGYTGSMGFLAFSQAVEDAQYGIKGVLNNIPQMVLGFGGTMGLAGAISLAAVAAVTLYPHLKKLFSIGNTDHIIAAMKAMDEAFEKGKEASDDIRTEFETARELKQLAEDHNAALHERLQLADALSTRYDDQLAADRAARASAKELLRARMALVAAEGGSTIPLQDQRNKAEFEGMRSDIANRENELKRAQQELLSLGEKRSNLTQEANEREAAGIEALVRLNERLTVAQTRLAGTTREKESRQKYGGAGLVKGTYGNLGVIELTQKKAVEAIEAEIKSYKERQTVIGEAASTALADTKAAISQLDARINKTHEEKKALEALIVQRRKLINLEARAAATTRALAEMKKGAQAAGQSIAERKRLEEESKRAAEELKSRNADRSDFGTEIAALRLELAGRKELAAALRSEMDLRKQAVDLSKELGISEAWALRILREKLALIEKLTATENLAATKTTRRRGIYRLENAADDFNSGNNLKKWRWGLDHDAPRIESRFGAGRNIEGGLRNSTLRNRARERALAPRPTDPVLKALERNNNLNEQMLDVFKRLGAI